MTKNIAELYGLQDTYIVNSYTNKEYHKSSLIGLVTGDSSNIDQVNPYVTSELTFDEMTNNRYVFNRSEVYGISNLVLSLVDPLNNIIHNQTDLNIKSVDLIIGGQVIDSLQGPFLVRDMHNLNLYHLNFDVTSGSNKLMLTFLDYHEVKVIVKFWDSVNNDIPIYIGYRRVYPSPLIQKHYKNKSLKKEQSSLVTNNDNKKEGSTGEGGGVGFVINEIPDITDDGTDKNYGLENMFIQHQYQNEIFELTKKITINMNINHTGRYLYIPYNPDFTKLTLDINNNLFTKSVYKKDLTNNIHQLLNLYDLVYVTDLNKVLSATFNPSGHFSGLYIRLDLSGLNFSRIDKATLTIESNKEFSSCALSIESYNILRFAGGLCGLAFSS